MHKHIAVYLFIVCIAVYTIICYNDKKRKAVAIWLHMMKKQKQEL